ncbi:MAG: hypothetical protein QOE51_2117 [Actinoplanes sp.]|nr:hypothetical protein [Actinoplanes sp.]
MSGGGVFKRCGCRSSETGRLLSSVCPQLVERGHGSWYFDCALPVLPGRRERLRRNWPQGETYCVTDADGRTSFGGVLEAEFRGDVLRVLFDDRTVAALRLREPEWELHLQDGDADLPKVRRQLTRVLTCGRLEFRPRRWKSTVTRATPIVDTIPPLT